MVPRKILGNFCVINDLSYPKGGSVNDSILKDEFSFKGVAVDKAIYFTNALGKVTIFQKLILRMLLG